MPWGGGRKRKQYFPLNCNGGGSAGCAQPEVVEKAEEGRISFLPTR